MQKKLSKLKYLTQFFPLRLNFFVFLFFLNIISRFALSSQLETSSFQHILILMSRIGFWIMCVILIISLLSTLLSCMYFIRHRHLFSVQIIKVGDKKNQFIEVKTIMEKIYRPILGSISVRYRYNKTELSPPFILNNTRSMALLPWVGHQSNIDLPNIKEYNLDSALLSFKDLFRFFSFTFNNPIQSQFINLPQAFEISSPTIQPKTTEQDLVRAP